MVKERMTEVAMVVVGQCSYWSGKLGVGEADNLCSHEQLVLVLLSSAPVHVVVVLVFVVCWEDGDAGWPLD